MKKRILFLMSDTGGGHRAAAQAIAEGIHYRYPDTYETLIEDIWRGHTPWPINQIPGAYGWLTGPGRPLWRLMWAISVRCDVHRLLFPGVSPLVERRVLSFLDHLQPALVISVHPFMNHLGLRWLTKLKLDIPFVTVVTDMVTIHPMWICPRVTRCLVPTDAARCIAIKLGMPPERVEVCGQPVGLKFSSMPADKPAVRSELGLDPLRCTVMVTGGGEGVGPIFEIARAIMALAIAGGTPRLQLLIVTGRNQALKARLEAVTWEIPTHIYGFIDYMPQLLRAADILITKAGPNTLSEAFIAGLPPIIFCYIPGQEQGNVAYVQAHQAGAYAEKPQEIARLVLSWLTVNNDILQEMGRNAIRLARPQAALAIADRVCSLI
jgi:1,2-diacylglycerol 3-beta-galactosyltransferase